MARACGAATASTGQALPRGIAGWRARRGTKARPPALRASDAEAAVVLSQRKHYRALNLTHEVLQLLKLPVPMDFYALLGLDFEEVHAKPLIVSGNPLGALLGLDHAFDPSATHARESPHQGFDQRLRQAYRRLQKVVHPDLAGETATEVAALVNLAFRTLSEPQARAAYDEELRAFRQGVGAFDGRPVSFWAGPDGETRAVFVDEATCIGCMQCTSIAPGTFNMEDEWGRARVHTQWGSAEDDVMDAVGSCPVDCIHLVPREQLALLEFVMKSCKRENVALMGRRRSGNMGSAPSSESPFIKAESFLRRRKSQGLEQVLSGGVARVQDDQLAAAISRAWLSLPHDVRCKGWPQWAQQVDAAQEYEQQGRGHRAMVAAPP